MIGWHLPLHYRDLPHKVDGLPVLFAASVGRRISITLLSLFSPLYILGIARNLGFSLQTSIAIVIAYFLVLFLAKVLIFPLTENLGIRIGFRGMLLFSGLPFLLFIPTLVLAESLPMLIIPAGIFWGLHAGIFWWGYHGFFIKAGRAISFGEELGAATALETLAMVVSPVGGALVIERFGFASVFWLAGLIFLFSLALLIPASERKPKVDIEIAEVLGLIKKHWRMALAYVGNGAESSIYTSVWPLFLFLVVGSTLGVGGIVSIAILVAAVLNFLVGVWVDKKGEREMILFGTPILAFSWFVRVLGRSPLLFVAADALWRFAEGMVYLPLNVLSYEKALEGSTNRAMMFRELSINGGVLLILLILMIWVLLGLDLVWIFPLTALFSLLPLIPVMAGRIHQHRKPI